MRELARYGMPADDALGAASWRAREWLGLDAALDEGAPADFVVYDRDPLADLSALRTPKRSCCVAAHGAGDGPANSGVEGSCRRQGPLCRAAGMLPRVRP